MTIGDAAITFSNEVTCLGVVFDQDLTFSVLIRPLSPKFFCCLHQRCMVLMTLTNDASKTLVHAFITSRMTIVTVSSVIQVPYTCIIYNWLARLIARNGNMTVSHQQSETGCRCHRALNLSYAQLCIHVFKDWHQHTSQLCINVFKDWHQHTSPRYAHLSQQSRGDLTFPLRLAVNSVPRSQRDI